MQAHSRKAHFTVCTELNIRIQLAKRKQLSVDQNPRENQLYTDPAEQNQMIVWCINILCEIF